MYQGSKSVNQIQSEPENENMQLAVNYSQFFYSQPIQNIVKYPIAQQQVQFQSKTPNYLGTVISSFELNKDLLNTYWVEAGIEMLNQPLENLNFIMNKGIVNYYSEFKRLQFKQLQNQTYQELRKMSQTADGKLLFHYISRNSSLQLADCIILQSDEGKAQPILITDVIKAVGNKVILIFDCNYAGNLIYRIKQDNLQHVLAFAATSIDEQLPYLVSQKRICPTDIFTLCMTKPLLGLLIGYIQRFQQQTNQIEHHTFMQIYQLYEKIVDDKQIELIMDAICENIAFSYLNVDQYKLIYSTSSINMQIIKNFLVSQRVLSAFNVKPTSTLNISDSSKDPLWSSFDAVLHKAIRFEKDINFIEQQLDAFNLQISFSHAHPSNLPIIIHLLKDQKCYLRAYQLISKYIDYSSENLEEIIMLGIGRKLMTRIVKLQKLAENDHFHELFRNIVFILSKMIQNSTQCIYDFIVFSNDNKIPFMFEEFILQQLTKQQTSVEVRIYITQILTILSSQNIDSVLHNVEQAYVSTYVKRLRQKLHSNNSIQILQTLFQSSSAQLRVWSILLQSKISQEIIYEQEHIQQIKQVKSFTSFKTSTQPQCTPYYLDNYCKQQQWDQIYSLLSYLTVISKMDDSLEVRAAAYQAIRSLLPDLKCTQKGLSISFLSTSNVDNLKQLLPDGLIQLLSDAVISEPSSVIRLQILMTILQIVVNKLDTFAKFICLQITQNSDQSFTTEFQQVSKLYQSLKLLCNDSQIIVQQLAQNILTCLQGLAQILLTQQIQISEWKIKLLSLYQITDFQFSELQQLVSTQNVSQNNIKSVFDEAVIKEQVKDTLKFNKFGVKTICQQQDFQKSKSEIQSTKLSPQTIIRPDCMIEDITSSPSEDYKPIPVLQRRQRTIKNLTFKQSFVQEPIETSLDQLLNQNEPQGDQYQIMYEDIYKQSIILMYDLQVISSLSSSYFGNRLFNLSTSLHSPIFALAVLSISQPNIYSNVWAQSVSISNFSRSIVQGCPIHSLLSIAQQGVFSNKPRKLNCQACQNLSISSTQQFLQQQVIKSCLHIFNQNQSQILQLLTNNNNKQKIESFYNYIQQNLDTNQGLNCVDYKVKQFVSILNEKDCKNLDLNLKKYISFEQQFNSQQRKQCIINICQSFLFSIPCDSISHYMIQNGAPITISNQVSEIYNRNRQNLFANMPKFDLLNLSNIILTPKIDNLNSLMSEGKICQKQNLHYNSNKAIKIFQNPIQSLQIIEPFKDCAQIQEDFQNLVSIDQSCDLCRKIAVKQPLLQQCSKLMSKDSKKQNQPLQYLFEPTRDIKILFRDPTKLSKTQKDNNQLQYQMSIQQQLKNLNAPFPELDQVFYCDPLFSRKSHDVFGRSLYRIIYQNSDNLINFHIVQKATINKSRVQSATQLQRIDSSSSFYSEFDNVSADLEQIWTNNKLQKQSKFNKRLTSLGIMNQQKQETNQQTQPIEIAINDQNYVQCNEPQPLSISEEFKDVFNQQYTYLKGFNQVKSQQIIQKSKIFWQFSTESEIKQVKFHPKLNYLIVIYQTKIQVYSVLQKLPINQIDGLTIKGHFGQYFKEPEAHSHHTLQPYLQSVYQTTSQFSTNYYTQYTSCIRDLEIQSQDCFLCNQIQQLCQYNCNKYDLIEYNCENLLNNQLKKNFFEQTQFNQDQFQQKNISIFDSNFVNENTTFQLLGVQELNGNYSLISNPYSNGASRQINSFTPFQQKPTTSFDWESVLPVFDLYRQIQGENGQIETAKSRISNYFKSITNEEKITHNNMFQASQVDQTAVFSQNSLKVYDISTQKLITESSLPSTASYQSVTGDFIAITGNKFTQIYDKRQKNPLFNEAQGYKYVKFVRNQIVKISENGEVFDGNMLISNYKAKPQGVMNNYFYDQTGSLYNLNSQKVTKMKIEGENICYNQDMSFACGWSKSGKIVVYQIE